MTVTAITSYGYRLVTVGNQNCGNTITNSIKLDGSLKGKVPEPFDRDRTKTQKFINAFSLFWMNNEDNSHMKNPYKRCTYFLGLFSGDKVDDWVQDQTEQLREKTTRNLGRIGKDQEELWIELTTAFSNAFAHTGRVEQARTELAKLEMEGNQIDEYIAKFENLLRKADIPRTEVGSIQKFKEGLRKGVLAAILRRDQWPETIDAWEEHAWREVRRLAIIKESLGERGNSHLSTKQAKWRTTAQQLKSSTRKKDGPVPMEIDATRTQQNPEKAAESARLRKEGRCYKCQQIGHLKKNCPEWPKKIDKPPPYPSKARTTALEPIKETGEEGPSDLKELARSMSFLDDDKKDELFDLLLQGNEEDF